jgi:hypothetical protein
MLIFLCPNMAAPKRHANLESDPKIQGTWEQMKLTTDTELQPLGLWFWLAVHYRCCVATYMEAISAIDKTTASVPTVTNILPYTRDAGPPFGRLS